MARRSDWTPQSISTALGMRFNGHTYEEIGAAVGKSKSSVHRLFSERDQNHDSLSPYEEQLVLSAVYCGEDTQAIAEKLGKSQEAIDSYVIAIIGHCKPGADGQLVEGQVYQIKPRESQGGDWDDVYGNARFEFIGWKDGAKPKAVFRSTIGHWKVTFTKDQIGDYRIKKYTP